MKRKLVMLLTLVVVAAVSGYAQDTNRILQAYRDRFRDASPETRLQILRTADMATVEELGPLYLQAVQSVLSRAAEIPRNVVLRDIALFAVEKIGEGGYTPATSALWTLFLEYDDNTARMLILEVLADIGGGDAQLVRDLNGWVQARVNLYRGGVMPDQQVLRRSVRTLGELGDPSSFPILLDLRLARISAVISDEANGAMRGLPGDYADAAVAAVNARGVAERREGLEYFLSEAGLEGDDRARVATRVLAHAGAEVLRDVTLIEEQRQVRYRAARELMDLSHPQAVEPLIRHFNLTFSDYERGMTTRTWVLEAIAALGATETERASRRLVALLDLLNTYTENDRPYDTQVMLAVITNLERIGDPQAADALFYVTMLDYPQSVRDAARAALNAVSQ